MTKFYIVDNQNKLIASYDTLKHVNEYLQTNEANHIEEVKLNISNKYDSGELIECCNVDYFKSHYTENSHSLLDI